MTGKPNVSKAEWYAGMRWWKKQNATLVMREDTGLSQCLRDKQGDIIPLRKQADFCLVFLYKMKEELLNGEKQMDGVKTKCASSQGADQRGLEQHRLEQASNRCAEASSSDCKGSKEKRYAKVKALQRILTTSFAAKALAVKRVTSNKGKEPLG